MRRFAIILCAFTALLQAGCRTAAKPGKSELLSSDPPLAVNESGPPSIFEQLPSAVREPAAASAPSAAMAATTPERPAANLAAANDTPPPMAERVAKSPARAASTSPPANAPASDAEVGQAIAELVAAGALDAAAEQQLQSDLAKTDPALRGQLVQLLRTSLTARTAAPTPAAAASTQPRTAIGENPIAADGSLSPANAQAAAAARPRAKKPIPPPVEPEAAVEPEAVVADDSDKPLAEARDASGRANEKTSPVRQAAYTETADSPASAQAAEQDNHPDAPPRTVAAPQVLPAVASSAAKRSAEQPLPAEDSLDWQEHLDAAIAKLSTTLGDKPETHEDVGRHAMLRMLYLIDGKRDMALSPIAGAPPTQHDFWSKELYGLASYLDSERNPNLGRRAAEAANHLREASARLGEMATLSVRNLTFCTEVKSYGIYKKFEHYDFVASQEVLLYAEVENFKSTHGEQGYHTALKGSYEILDSKGARVVEQEFPITEEHCQNPRRDFFVRYFVTLPPHIYGGQYTLHLYIVDENSHKMDHATIEFSIKSKAGS